MGTGRPDASESSITVNREKEAKTCHASDSSTTPNHTHNGCVQDRHPGRGEQGGARRNPWNPTPLATLTVSEKNAFQRACTTGTRGDSSVETAQPRRSVRLLRVTSARSENAPVAHAPGAGRGRHRRAPSETTTRSPDLQSLGHRSRRC